MKILDLTGERFGHLIAIGLTSDWLGPSRRICRWWCLCDCGKLTIARLGHLRSGHTTSCGCQRVEEAKRRMKHGYCTRTGRPPEYGVWHGMIKRCYDKRNPAYADYGGRGIGICDRWRENFKYFIVDMGFRPTRLHTLERTDNNGDYGPTNCIWATRITQGRNKRNNRVIEAQGLRLCLQEWSDRTGIDRKTITERLSRGWSSEKATSAPPLPR